MEDIFRSEDYPVSGYPIDIDQDSPFGSHPIGTYRGRLIRYEIGITRLGYEIRKQNQFYDRCYTIWIAINIILDNRPGYAIGLLDRDR